MAIQRHCDTIRIRELPNMTIMFYDERTVYIKTESTTYCIHRWFMRERGFYSKHFKPFVWVLRNNLHLDIYEILRLAERHEMVIQWGRFPSIEGKKVKYLNSKGRTR